MGAYVAQRLVRLLVKTDVRVKGAKVGILGVTFKENVPDIRNSRIPDIVSELREFGIDPMIYDPLADAEEVAHEYGLTLESGLSNMSELDAVILAVPHQEFLEKDNNSFAAILKSAHVVMDLKSVMSPDDFKKQAYWSL
jgi:UDP-N-acetyl-D-galactosamine dehydrogenase